MYQTGNYQGAIAEYQKLIDLQQANVDIYQKLNHFYRKVDQRFDYLILNQLSDVFLDTFTGSGGNTSLEAIACNLPIVTCPGEFMRGRHADSFLKLMDLTETIAKNEAEYIEIAVKLGLDPQWRKSISQRLSERHHLIFDDQVCIAGLEEFYQRVVAEI